MATIVSRSNKNYFETQQKIEESIKNELNSLFAISHVVSIYTDVSCNRTSLRFEYVAENKIETLTISFNSSLFSEAQLESKE